MKVNKSSPVPIYQQIADDLRQQIENHTLAPGSRVPSEAELAVMHQISRMTARKALDVLMSEGLILRQPGKGTFVANTKVAFRPSSLFSFSSSMRALGYSVTTKVLDFTVVTASAKVAEELRLPPGAQVILLKRLRSVEGEPLSIDTTHMPYNLFQQILARDVVEQPVSKVMEEVSGIKIATSRDYAEAVTALPDEARLLDVRVGFPLLLIEGVAYSSSGLPLRTAKAVYRSDRFRFSIGGEIAYKETGGDQPPPGL